MKLSDEYLEDLVTRTAYHSNALDNRRITLPETASIIVYDTIPKRISLDNLYAIDNFKYAFGFLVNTHQYTKGLSVDMITETHQILRHRLQKNQKESNMNFSLIEPLIDDLNKNLLAAKTPDDIVKIACTFHIDFIHTNDFRNGRTGRLLLSILLWQHQIPPFVIQKEDEDEYWSFIKNRDIENFQIYVNKKITFEKPRSQYLMKYED